MQHAHFSQARYSYTRFHPRYVLADAGYSSAALDRLVKRQSAATPAIDLNRQHQRLLERPGSWYWSSEWKALYKQRQAVERAFSCLKNQRSLNRITVRRRRKVTAHCYLSLITLQAGRAGS